MTIRSVVVGLLLSLDQDGADVRDDLLAGRPDDGRYARWGIPWSTCWPAIRLWGSVALLLGLGSMCMVLASIMLVGDSRTTLMPFLSTALRLGEETAETRPSRLSPWLIGVFVGGFCPGHRLRPSASALVADPSGALSGLGHLSDPAVQQRLPGRLGDQGRRGQDDGSQGLSRGQADYDRADRRRLARWFALDHGRDRLLLPHRADPPDLFDLSRLSGRLRSRNELCQKRQHKVGQDKL